MPAVCQRVWSLFWRLDLRRQSNGYSALAIPHSEIESIQKLIGVTLAGWEVETVDAMEHERLRWLNASEEERKREVRPMQSNVKLSADLFDAMFGSIH